MIDYTALAGELSADPAGLGYAGKDDPTCAGLLNATTGPGAATVAITQMSSDAFIQAFLPFLDGIANLNNPAKKDKFWRVWDAIRSQPLVHVGAANVQAVLADAVAQGVLTGAQAQALSQRAGSRAEVLFGAGTAVGDQDVGRARVRGS